MFVLMECIDRELSADFYPYHHDAWTAMLENMKKLSPETMEDYEGLKDSDGYVLNDGTGCRFEIMEDHAWMNADGGDMHCDWKIVRIPDKLERTS